MDTRDTNGRFGRWLVLVWLVACLAAALRIYGYYHPDEFGQIVSFYLMKLGAIPASELPWEYEERMRPWLQPALYYVILYPVHALVGFRHLLFETITQLFQFALVAATLPLFLRLIRTEQGRPLDGPGRMFRVYMATLWFVPFMVVRHSSEAFSIVLLVVGLYCWRRSAQGDSSPGPASRDALLFALGAGVFAGLSAWVRFQLGFFWAAFFPAALVYHAVARRSALPLYAMAFGGILLGAGFGLLVDRWGYGAWTFPPYNYLFHNIVEDVSSSFGTEPWHWYFRQATEFMVTPLFLIILVRAMFVARGDSFLGPVALGLITFVAAHSAVPHKEIRFLLPMIVPVALLLFFLHTRPCATPANPWWARAQMLHWGLAIAVNLVAFGITFYIRGVREKYQVSRELWRAPAGTTVFTYSNMFGIFDRNHEDDRLRWPGEMEPWIRPPFVRLEYMRPAKLANACEMHPGRDFVLLSMAETIPNPLRDRLDAPPASGLLVDLDLPVHSRFPNAWWERKFPDLYETHWRYKLVRCADYLEFVGRLKGG